LKPAYLESPILQSAVRNHFFVPTTPITVDPLPLSSSPPPQSPPEDTQDSCVFPPHPLQHEPYYTRYDRKLFSPPDWPTMYIRFLQTL
uniref:Proline rich protein n=1 Tax=Rodentolepis nana TaxID=102285 RepID=A0A0R3TFK5_RODNA